MGDGPYEVNPGQAEVYVVISKPKWFAHSIVWLAVASGFFIGGRLGLALSALCFTLGVGLLGTHLTVWRRGNHTQQADAAADQAIQVLVTVKEAHAYCESDQNPEFTDNSNQLRLDLDVFLHVWLVSEAETELGIKRCQLKITTPDGSVRSAEPIPGDLKSWRLDRDLEETDLWDTYIERVREPLRELNVGEALQCGEPREGWLRFQVRDITVSTYKTGAIEFLVEDSQSVTSVAPVNCSRYLSGKVERNELGDPPHISPAALTV